MFGREETKAGSIGASVNAGSRASISSYIASGASARELSLAQRLSCYCGGIIGQMGWGFLLLGSIFAWIFVPQADLHALIPNTSALIPHTASITKTVKTNASEGGSDSSPGTPIYANHFAYTVDAKQYQGVSYSVGRQTSKGARVKIYYTEGAPEDAYIVGMRRNIFSALVLFVLLFPAIGLFFVLKAAKEGRKNVHLFRWGKTAMGTFVRKTATLVRINNSTVYRYIYSFEAEDGTRYEGEGRTHKSSLLPSEADSQTELLYDPLNPTHAQATATLPGGVKLNERKQLVSTISVFAQLLLPTLTVLAQIFAIHLLYFS